MHNEKTGFQTISCSVKTCCHNGSGNSCELSRIEVKPCKNHPCTGDPEDESLCASYKTK